MKGHPQWIRPVIGADRMSRMCPQLFRVTGVKYLWPGQSFNTPLHCVQPTRLVPSVVGSPPVANTPKVSLTFVQYVASHHSCTSSWTLNHPCRERLLYFVVVTGQNSIFFFYSPGQKMVAHGSRWGWEGLGSLRQGLGLQIFFFFDADGCCPHGGSYRVSSVESQPRQTAMAAFFPLHP